MDSSIKIEYPKQTPPVHESVSTDSALRCLYHFATPVDRLLVIVAAALFFASGVVNSFMGLLMGTGFALKDPNASLALQGRTLFFYLAGLLGSSFFTCYTLGALCAVHARRRMIGRWRIEYLRAVLRQDVGWFDVNRGQQLAGRMGESVAHIDKAFSGSIYMGLMPLGYIIGAVIIAFVVVPEMAAIAVGLALLLCLPAAIVLARTLESRTSVLAEAYAEAGAFAAEMLGAIRTVAAFGLEGVAAEKYDSMLERAERVSVATSFRISLANSVITSFIFFVAGAVPLYNLAVRGRQMTDSAAAVVVGNVSLCVPVACRAPYNPITLAAAMSSNASAAIARGGGGCDEAAGWEAFVGSCASAEPLAWLLGLGGDASSGVPTLGSLINPEHAAALGDESTWGCGSAGFEYMLAAVNAIIFGFFQAPQLPVAVTTLLKGAVAARSCLALIRRVPTIDSFSPAGVSPESMAGLIVVRDVHFAYPAALQTPVCIGFSLTVPPGSSCALCGASGCGKSTIVSLLERFYDPFSGSITIDGTELAHFNVLHLRRRLGLVGQEPVLFRGSIEENIRYGKPEATPEEVHAAAELASAADFIEKALSEGYATQVGQGGFKLSGGQKQRVAIARVLIKQPAILLLDEATSALDNQSERAVQAALDRITRTQGFTSLIIAHRLTTIRHVDKIAVVSGGRVAEEGNYDELMSLGDGGVFHTLAAKVMRAADVEADAGTDGHAISEGGVGEERSAAPEAGGALEATEDGTRSAGGTSTSKEIDVEHGGGAAEVRGVDSTTSTRKRAADAHAKGADPTAVRKKLSARLMEMYSPTDKRLLTVGTLGAVFDGLARGVFGIVIVKATFPFRDEFQPSRLREEIHLWAGGSLIIGVLVLFVNTGYLTCFTLTGEHMTRRLRLISLAGLLRYAQHGLTPQPHMQRL